jgi:hypothetical protein
MNVERMRQKSNFVRLHKPRSWLFLGFHWHGDLRIPFPHSPRFVLGPGQLFKPSCVESYSVKAPFMQLDAPLGLACLQLPLWALPKSDWAVTASLVASAEPRAATEDGL